MPELGYRIISLEGFEILVGKSARDNDHLSLKVARPRDLWLHAHGFAGSHVVVRAAGPDPESGDDAPRPTTADVPRTVIQRAAELAAWHSKGRGSHGKVAVHVCRAEDVSKPRGAPPGQVRLHRWDVVKVYPRDMAPT
jgi:predicted ribosome quality control (RQC) complex YloA/Tae2 family protein